MGSGRPPFPRIFAPLLQRPTSRLAHGIGPGAPLDPDRGFRTYSDEPFTPGRVLEVDVLLPDRSTVGAVVRVAWCDPLPAGDPARFDVGLALARVDLADLARLEVVLRPRAGSPPRPTTGTPPARAEDGGRRARELQEALRLLLESRERFLAALRASPEDLAPLREEDQYLAALSSARAVLSGPGIQA